MPHREDLLKQFVELDPPQREELLLDLSDLFFSIHPMTPGWLHRIPLPDFPSIVATPGVCGGAARLIRTRIPVWVLERMRQTGVSEADILRSYPTLQAIDLAQAWSYVARHREEIEREIRENEGE